MVITSYPTSSGGPSNPSAVITTITKATEIFRSTTRRLVYVHASTNLTFSLFPIPEDTSNPGKPDFGSGYLSLHPVTSIQDGQSVFNFNLGVDLLNNATLFTQQWTPSSQTLRYVSSNTNLQPGYYIIKAIIPPSLPPAPVKSPIKLSFSSDAYTCPFDPAFPDHHMNYQPCQTPVKTGESCI